PGAGGCYRGGMRRLPDFLTAVRVANSRLRLLFGIGLPLGELTRGELPQRDGLPTQVPPGAVRPPTPGCATRCANTSRIRITAARDVSAIAAAACGYSAS